MKKRPRQTHVMIEVTVDATISEPIIEKFINEALYEKIKSYHQDSLLSYATYSILSVRKLDKWK